MAKIYGTITLDDSEKLKIPDDGYGHSYQNDPIQKLEVTLKGRKYFKYIEVSYENKMFYGYVHWDVNIDDLKFSHRGTVNFRLISVYIQYGPKESDRVQCYDDTNIYKEYEELVKCSFFNELLGELGVGFAGSGEEHVDTILEAIRSVKILKGNDILSLVKNIDTLQTENARLIKEYQAVLDDWQKTNRRLDEQTSINTQLQEQVDTFTKERDDYKKEMKTRILNAIDKDDDTFII